MLENNLKREKEEEKKKKRKFGDEILFQLLKNLSFAKEKLVSNFFPKDDRRRDLKKREVKQNFNKKLEILAAI